MNIGIMGKIHPDGLEVFKNNNISFIDLESFDKDYLIKNLKNVDGIVLRTAKLDKDILKELTKLKIVSRHGVGYDNVDIDFLNKNLENQVYVVPRDIDDEIGRLKLLAMGIEIDKLTDEQEIYLNSWNVGT